MTRPTNLIALWAASVLAIAVTSPASAATQFVARPDGAAASLTLVRDGCGQGRYRNQYGHCHWMNQQRMPYGQDMNNSDSSQYRSTQPMMDQGSSSHSSGGGMGGGGMGGGGMGGGHGR